MVSATRAAKDPDWAFVPLGAVFCLCQRCDTCPNLWKKDEKIVRFSNFWVILETCPNLWWRSCSKCYAIDCFGIHTWNMSKPVMTFVVLRNRLLRYMSKPVMTFVFKVLRNRLLRYILETCPNLWWRSCSKCYAIDCVGTYLKHVLDRVCSATL